jgi:hypothetical protein
MPYLLLSPNHFTIFQLFFLYATFLTEMTQFSPKIVIVTLTKLFSKARINEANLVKGDCHHSVGEVEGLLDPVAVMYVDVDVQNTRVHLKTFNIILVLKVAGNYDRGFKAYFRKIMVRMFLCRRKYVQILKNYIRAPIFRI